MTKRPFYEALDATGREHMRHARVVGELPHEARQPALEEATAALGNVLGIEPTGTIAFGAPIGLAFMTRADIRKHANADLLRKLGDDLPLDHCPSYN